MKDYKMLNIYYFFVNRKPKAQECQSMAVQYKLKNEKNVWLHRYMTDKQCITECPLLFRVAAWNN